MRPHDLEDHSAENLALLAPILDEAVNQLGPDDRTAIMLRYFEQHDFKSVGEALGSNEAAVRKRVDRALDKLQALLKARGVALSTTVLASTLAAQTVTAAPAGLALTVSTAALASATSSSGTTLTILKIMSMSKMKTGLIAVVIAAGVAIPFIIQHRAQTRLDAANEALRQQSEQGNKLAAENERLARLAARPTAVPKPTNGTSTELMRLRGEVGRLLKESAIEQSKTNGPSALSGMKANPEMWQTLRTQQKMGMTMIYKEFAKRLDLAPEQAGKLNDMLADNVMENIDHITEVLRDAKTPAQMEPVFAGQEAAMLAKVKELLGPDGYAQYQEYTRNLVSYLTAEQFKGMLTGEQDAKDGKSKQLYQLMQEETQRALSSAGLPPDYQTMPILNFRNIASEESAEANLKLLDGVYERVAARAGPFLSPEELEKFGGFRTSAITGNRMSLAMNRKLMAPGAK